MGNGDGRGTYLNVGTTPDVGTVDGDEDFGLVADDSVQGRLVSGG